MTVTTRIGHTVFACQTATGAGSRKAREALLIGIAERATADEQSLLRRIIGGEMRTGVSDGLVLDAIGRAAGAPASVVRRAALFLGDLSAVGVLARAGGPDALAAVTPRLFLPLSPMLAEPTTDWAQVLANASEPAVPVITRNVIEVLGRLRG